MGMLTVYQSGETEADLKDQLDYAIKTAAERHEVEEAIIRAFCGVEGQNFVFAYRVDHSILVNQYWYAKLLTDEERPHKKYWASYGVMQILYGLAKALGYTGPAEGLFDPVVNVDLATKHFKACLITHTVFKRAISAYNYGHHAWHDTNKNGVHDLNEDYKNQAYVDKVYKLYKKYGGKN